MKEIPKAYDSKKAEDKIYAAWEESGFFNPDNLPEGNIKKDKDGKEKTYTIILPPPNITSKLHLGHAAMLAIEDLLIRYHRMKGYRTLWIPGTDHAAIATQNVVEKKLLREEKLTRHDLGREKFLKKVWEYLKKTQVVILNQTRKMGASLDWSREAFTLDKQREKAARKMFVDMYEAGVIYRGERIVNWCPRCHSTLADDEVEYKKQKAKLYTFKYSHDFPFAIATTRPETKLGDTAVAVNPKDKRYKKYIGKTYAADFCGVKLKLKIIADRHVEMDFGTGALGVTPAHSMADWQMAEENNLEIIKVIGEDGKIKNGFGDYSGKSVLEARKIIIEELKKNNLLEKSSETESKTELSSGYPELSSVLDGEEMENNLSLCYRCGTAIEPLPSKQWFINVNKKLKRLGDKSLKEKAIAAAKDKSIKFIPERFEKRYLDWMENLHDWCISRQIWFGHRIPVYYKIKNQKSKIDITYFVHGTTIDNENNKASGHHDAELSELGIQQSKDLRETIKDQKFDVVFCSDLKRAVDSANLVFGDRDIKIVQDKRLRECDYGDLTRSNAIKVLAIEKEVINKSFPNGESYQDVENRIKSFLKDLSDKYQDKKIAIVAHKASQLALDVILKRKTWEQAFDEDWRKKKEWQAGWEYELKNKEEIYVGIEPPEGRGWVQDEDSLDTWFSSGMWTFSTLGWPDNFEDGKKINDLAKFHPTQVLETGYEILTLWVSRMVIMSFFALREIPFENVYLHGMLLDKYGKKMSKSKGNGIDPIEVIEKYGTDAVRLSLLIGSTPGNDVRFSEEKIEGQRNFVNKLWNVSRYILQNQESRIKNQEIDCKNLTLADRWILSKLNNLIEEVTDNLESYKFSPAGEKLRDFTWNDFADWYIEISKIEKNKDEILIYVLKQLLILWHPFIPFVTEEIWKNTKLTPNPSQEGNIHTSKNPPSPLLQRGNSQERNGLLMVEKCPGRERKFSFPTTESDFEIIKNIIVAIRNARAEYKIEPSKKIEAVIYAGEAENENFRFLQSQSDLIKNLRTGIDKLEIKEKGGKIKDAVYLVVGDIEIYLLGMADKEKEKKNLEKEINNLKKYLSQIKNKLDNKDFTANAPKEIIEREKNKYDEGENKLKKLKEKSKSLSE